MLDLGGRSTPRLLLPAREGRPPGGGAAGPDRHSLPGGTDEKLSARTVGGMQQRVMIAMALSCRPKLLIADEPTTALDVTVQAQILDLIRELRERSGMALLFITHDLGVVSELCDWVAVMYLGHVVEEAETDTLFGDPRHPYTQVLLSALPGARPRGGRRTAGRREAKEVFDRPDPRGCCAFHTRCAWASERCRAEVPPLRSVADGHRVACFLIASKSVGDELFDHNLR